GVSLGSLANSLVSLVAWTLYGAAHGYGWVVAGSVVGAPATVATLAIARREGVRIRLVVPALWAGVLVVAAAAAVLVAPGMLDLAIGCSIPSLGAPRGAPAL